MNPAVLDLAQKIADEHNLKLRDVLSRFRRAGLQFRTETVRAFDSAPRDEHTILGFAYDGYFYPYTDEANRQQLLKLVLAAAPEGRKTLEPAAPSLTAG